MSRSRICVIGLGYVGLTLATTLAKVGFQVYGLERDREKASAVRKGESPFYEPQLAPLLSRCLEEGSFEVAETLDSIRSVRFDTIFSCVGTPLETGGQGPDLSQVTGAAKQVGGVLRDNALIVNRSTVPVGTTRSVFLPILEEESGLKAGEDFLLACAPERTVQGAALRELRELPQIVGGINDESVSRAADVLNRVTRTIVRVSSLEAAEIIKLFDNTYRDVNIAVGNVFGLICEDLSLNAHEIIQAANFGYSRNRLLLPGAAAGGTCLSKDPYLLLAPAGLTRDYALVRMARSVNEGMPLHVANILREELAKIGLPLGAASVLVLGFAFKGKPPTDDVRNSPTRVLVESVAADGPRLFGYDPAVARADIESMGVTPVKDLEEVRGVVDAVVVMTNHDAFAGLDVAQLRRTDRPLVVVDGWNILDSLVSSKDVIYRCVGIGVPRRSRTAG